MKRLIKADNQLNNRSEDLFDTYDFLDQQYTLLLDKSNQIKNVLSDLSDVNYVVSELEDLNSDFLRTTEEMIQSMIAAKDIGIFNEDALLQGNEVIHYLEQELIALESSLSKINADNSSISNEINEAQKILGEIESINKEIEGSNTKTKLKKLAGKMLRNICEVHEVVRKTCEYMANECGQIINDIVDKLISNDFDIEYELQQFDITMNNYLNEIRDDIMTGRNMNQRMGSAIERKENLIEELTQKIENITTEIGQMNIKNGNLTDQRNDLLRLLSELKGE